MRLKLDSLQIKALKNKIIRPALIALFFMFPIIAGCEKVSELIEDYFSKGTNIGYMRCLEKNKDKGLRIEAVEALFDLVLEPARIRLWRCIEQ